MPSPTKAPHASMSCGFDFGTSNSSIGHFAGNSPKLIPIQHGRVAIPTALFFSSEDGTTYFGRDAIDRYLSRDEGRLLRSLKSVLGSSLIHETTMVRRERLRFLDIIALFIKLVRNAANAPNSVVMGRPVHFVDDNDAADREAEDQLRAAAMQAGFAHVEFQFEPIAAALDYEHTVTSEQLAFVVDIGGGTSDFSLVRVSPDRRGKSDRKSDILGTGGIHIGGTDFDKYLDLRVVMPHLGMGSKLKHKNMEPPVWWYHDLATWQRINMMYDPRVATEIKQVRRDAQEPIKLDRLLHVIDTRNGHALLGAVEHAKIALSDAPKATLPLHDYAKLPDIEITRKQLDAAIGASIEKVGTEARETLKRAHVSAKDIDVVFLTGGSSKLPLLQTQIGSIFPGAQLIEGDAFASVATGLTIDARNRFGG